MPTSPVRPYLGETAENRVTLRRARLVESAFDQMASRGWRSLTIESVCREAKLNKRYFYESFDDLDALCAAVVDDLSAALILLGADAAQSATGRGLSTAELAREVLGVVVGYVLDDPRRARVLFSEIADTPRAVAQRRTTMRALASALAAYGYEHHRETSDTDPISELASAVLIGGSIEAIEAWLAGEVAMTREQFVDDLAALWVSTGDGALAIGRARRDARERGR